MLKKVIIELTILLLGMINNANFVYGGAVKKIQYFPCTANTNACSLFINLNSACIRCETCLLIANQIDQIIALLHKQMFPTNNMNETQAKEVVTFICDYSFENYGLEEVNGKRAIFDYIPTATRIITNVDAQWDTHLKERCHELTEALGTAKLYETWKLSLDDGCSSGVESVQLETALCREENAFLRDCRGISSVGRHNLVSHKNQRLVGQIIKRLRYEEMFS